MPDVEPRVIPLSRLDCCKHTMAVIVVWGARHIPHTAVVVWAPAFYGSYHVHPDVGMPGMRVLMRGFKCVMM